MTLKPIVDAIAKVQFGADKTAAELTLRRLQDELRNLETNRIALHGQASRKCQSAQIRAAVWSIPMILLGLVLFAVGKYVIGLGVLLIGIAIVIGAFKTIQTNIKLRLSEQLRSVASEETAIKEKIARNKGIAD